jgi:hypothetical protein
LGFLTVGLPTPIYFMEREISCIIIEQLYKIRKNNVCLMNIVHDKFKIDKIIITDIILINLNFIEIIFIYLIYWLKEKKNGESNIFLL